MLGSRVSLRLASGAVGSVGGWLGDWLGDWLGWLLGDGLDWWLGDWLGDWLGRPVWVVWHDEYRRPGSIHA